MRIKPRRHNGFSLIEISLALLIIAGLAGITLYSYARVTNNHSVNVAAQETANLVDAFRQYASTEPSMQKAGLVNGFVNRKQYPRSLKVTSINGDVAIFNRSGLTWQLNANSTCSQCFNVKITDFGSPQSCALAARVVIKNKRAMQEAGINSYAIDNISNASTDPQAIANVESCNDIYLIMTKNN